MFVKIILKKEEFICPTVGLHTVNHMGKSGHQELEEVPIVNKRSVTDSKQQRVMLNYLPNIIKLSPAPFPSHIQ